MIKQFLWHVFIGCVLINMYPLMAMEQEKNDDKSTFKTFFNCKKLEVCSKSIRNGCFGNNAINGINFPSSTRMFIWTCDQDIIEINLLTKEQKMWPKDSMIEDEDNAPSIKILQLDPKNGTLYVLCLNFAYIRNNNIAKWNVINSTVKESNHKELQGLNNVDRIFLQGKKIFYAKKEDWEDEEFIEYLDLENLSTPAVLIIKYPYPKSVSCLNILPYDNNENLLFIEEKEYVDAGEIWHFSRYRIFDVKNNKTIDKNPISNEISNLYARYDKSIFNKRTKTLFCQCLTDDNKKYVICCFNIPNKKSDLLWEGPVIGESVTLYADPVCNTEGTKLIFISYKNRKEGSVNILNIQSKTPSVIFAFSGDDYVPTAIAFGPDDKPFIGLINGTLIWENDNTLSKKVDLIRKNKKLIDIVVVFK